MAPATITVEVTGSSKGGSSSPTEISELVRRSNGQLDHALIPLVARLGDLTGKSQGLAGDRWGAEADLDAANHRLRSRPIRDEA